MNERIIKLREQSLNAEETISIERARLLTEFYSSGLADRVLFRLQEPKHSNIFLSIKNCI